RAGGALAGAEVAEKPVQMVDEPAGPTEKRARAVGEDEGPLEPRLGDQPQRARALVEKQARLRRERVEGAARRDQRAVCVGEEAGQSVRIGAQLGEDTRTLLGELAAGTDQPAQVLAVVLQELVELGDRLGALREQPPDEVLVVVEELCRRIEEIVE